MNAVDVPDTLELELDASGCNLATGAQKPLRRERISRNKQSENFGCDSKSKPPEIEQKPNQSHCDKKLQISEKHRQRMIDTDDMLGAELNAIIDDIQHSKISDSSVPDRFCCGQ